MRKFFQTKLGKIIQTGFSEKYLLYTNIAISGFTSGLSDFMVQHVEIQRGKLKLWSYDRTKNMTVAGMTVGGMSHYWYKFLDATYPGTATSMVVKKILLDQIVWTPIYVTVLFLMWGFLEHQTKDEIIEEMRDKFMLLYVADWAFWPSAQFVNFYFVPPNMRMVYDNSVSLAFDTFTSHVKHYDSDPKK